MLRPHYREREGGLMVQFLKGKEEAMAVTGRLEADHAEAKQSREGVS